MVCCTMIFVPSKYHILETSGAYILGVSSVYFRRRFRHMKVYVSAVM